MTEKNKKTDIISRLNISKKDKLCLKKDVFGLPYDIWLISADSEIARELPIIEVDVGDHFVYVTISRDNPVSQKDFPRETEIFDWVLDNYRTLTRHYHRELTDSEVRQILMLPPDIED